MSATPTLVLASASPRRLDLLRRIGLDPVVDPADVDETVPPGTTPAVAALDLARHKAATVAERRSDHVVVLGSDTLVALGQDALGKPTSPDDAVSMLRRLSGRTHQVHTGVSTIGVRTGLCRDVVVSTVVSMRPLTDDDIAAYVATGEPLDKAGSYAIQGLAALFVDRIDGDHSNVVGLPLPATARLLADHGIDVVAGWRTP